MIIFQGFSFVEFKSADESFEASFTVHRDEDKKFTHVTGSLHMGKRLFELDFCGEDCNGNYVLIEIDMDKINEEEKNQVESRNPF